MASARISCSVSSSKFFTSFSPAAKTQPNSRPTIIGSTEQNVVGHFRPGARLRCHSERSDVTPLLFAGGARVTLRSRGIPLSPISSEDADPLPASRHFRQRVLELVRMLSVGNLDRHSACKSHQLAGTRVRHYRNHQLWRASPHGPAV